MCVCVCAVKIFGSTASCLKLWFPSFNLTNVRRLSVCVLFKLTNSSFITDLPNQCSQQVHTYGKTCHRTMRLSHGTMQIFTAVALSAATEEQNGLNRRRERIILPGKMWTKCFQRKHPSVLPPLWKPRGTSEALLPSGLGREDNLASFHGFFEIVWHPICRSTADEVELMSVISRRARRRWIVDMWVECWRSSTNNNLLI